MLQTDRSTLQEKRSIGQAAGSAVPPAGSTVQERGKKAGTPDGGADAGDGQLRFHPARYAKTYETWHDNIRDWCISRQLWWGHRIPVWTARWVHGTEESLDRFVAEGKRLVDEGRIAGGGTRPSSDLGWELTRDEIAEDTLFFCVRSEEDSEAITFLEEHGFEQDPDVLDTWFSSALWPISTMGWPDDTDTLRAFNPTSTLCTAREIITLWVSRMVMFNRYFRSDGATERQSDEGKAGASGTGSDPSVASSLGRSVAFPGPVPFRDVFIHSVIQDGEGRKMSKTLGNGVDPLDIIATHGADAMRFTLCHMTTQTQDVRLPVVKDSASGKNTSPKFDLGRNFANKLWNAARFALGILSDEATQRRSDEGKTGTSGEGSDPSSLRRSVALSLPDRWMLSRLSVAVEACNTALREFQFADYATTLYDLLWRDFCDWYLEAIKPTVASDPHQRAVLAATLDTILRLLHPVMPYVTEAIYEAMREQSRTIRTDAVPGVGLGPARKADLLATAGWPEVDPALRDEAAEREFEGLRAFITAIREVRAQHNVQPKRRITLHAPAATPILKDAGNATLVKTLAGVESITQEAPAGPSVAFNLGTAEFRVSDLADAATMDTGAEKARLEKLVADLDKSVATFEGRLANPGYAQKAPPHMVQQTKDQLEKARAERAAAAAALLHLA